MGISGNIAIQSISPTRITGFRPMRSEMRPASGLPAIAITSGTQIKMPTEASLSCTMFFA
jgi:hypothetical protein